MKKSIKYDRLIKNKSIRQSFMHDLFVAVWKIKIRFKLIFKNYKKKNFISKFTKFNFF